MSRLLQTFLAPGDVLATRVRRLAWATPYLGYLDDETDPEAAEGPSVEYNSHEASETISIDHPNSLEREVGGVALFKAAASVFGIDNSLQSSSAQFLLLLHLLPSLQVLHVTPPDDNGILDDFVDALTALQPVATLPLALQSLRYPHRCTYMNSVRGVVPEFRMTIMRLPHIATIVVQLIGGHYTKETADACVASSRVEHLRLMFAPVTPALLNDMLKIPVALKSFSYIPILTTMIDLQAVGVALRPHRKSLEYLELQIVVLDGGGGGTRNTIESLRHWPALVRISGSLCMLVRKFPQKELRPLLVNGLPACLRGLEITFDRYWSVAEVAEEVIVMLGEKQNMLPGLRRLVSLLRVKKSPELLGSLRSACVAAGVELIVDDSCVVTDCFTKSGNAGKPNGLEGVWWERTCKRLYDSQDD